MSGRAAHVGLAGSQGQLKTRKQAGVQEPGWRVETYNAKRPGHTYVALS